jgi:hypothetical protein
LSPKKEVSMNAVLLEEDLVSDSRVSASSSLSLFRFRRKRLVPVI